MFRSTYPKVFGHFIGHKHFVKALSYRIYGYLILSYRILSCLIVSYPQSCYNHKTGAPFYSIDKEANRVHLPIGCYGRFWVCYVPRM